MEKMAEISQGRYPPRAIATLAKCGKLVPSYKIIRPCLASGWADKHWNMYTQILQKLGLSENEAKMYELLLLKGESKAVDLVPESGLKRGNVYNVLISLVSRGLVTVSSKKLQLYRAAEPTKLSALLEAKKRETARLENEFREELPRLMSAYHLSTGRPAIRVLEGYEGAEEAVRDALGAPDGILAYLNVGAMAGKFAEIHKLYLKKRLAAKIPKYILVADTPEARAFFAGPDVPLTFVAYLRDYPSDFNTAMEVYGNKVAYITLAGDKQISVIKEDANIARMHRAQFHYLWKIASGESIQPLPAV